MAARTSWNPRYERAPDYYEDDAYPDGAGYDDLLDQGFDEHGRLTRRRPRAQYEDMAEPRERADLRHAVDSLARRVESLARQPVRSRGSGREPAQSREREAPSARTNQTLQALDRLESRLDALQGEAQLRADDNANQEGLERMFAEQSAAEREKVEALMESHFAVLNERIAALHDLARGKNVDTIRDDLAALGSRIEGMAADGLSVSGSVDQVRQQLAELRERLDTEGWSGASAVSALQDRLELITDKLAQLELTPSALSAVELGYSNILERVSRIEQLAGQAVAGDDLTSRLDALRDQIARLENRDGLGSLEYRVAALSDNIDSLAAQRGSDPAFDRVELKLADMARTIGTIRDRRDVHSGAIETRLADIAARVDKLAQDRGRIDFAPVERQIAALSSRIDRIGEDRQDIDLTGMESQLAELGSRIETMLDRAEPEAGPDFDQFELRLAQMHARLEDVLAAADAGRDENPPAVLEDIDRRLAGLNGRLDELALTTGNEPADLSPISSRLDAIDGRLNDLADDRASASPPVELSILSSKLNLIDEQLRDMAPANPDLPALFERLAEIDGRISKISEMQVDFSPVAEQIAALEHRLTESEPAAGFDLQPVSGRLERIEARLDTMSAADSETSGAVAERLEDLNRRLDDLPQPAEIDLSPLGEQLSAIDRQLHDIGGAGEESVDLSPLTHRLDRFEEYLAAFKPGDLIDLSDIRAMLGGLDERIANLAAMPLAASDSSEPVAPDFSVITDRLLRIDQRIAALDVRPEPVDLSPVTERLAELDRRFSELDVRPEPVDLSPVTDRLHAIDERISAFNVQPEPVDMSPVTDRLHAMDERLSTLSIQPEPVDMSPVTDRLHAIEERLEAYQASDSPVNDNLMPLLETLEGALRKIASTDEISELAEKVGGLHAALDNAAEGTAIDEMAELRNDITYLRRELRSMPMMAESDDGSGGLGSMLADIRERLDRMPVEQPVTFRDLEDQIGRIVRSIEAGGGGTGPLSQIEASLASIETRLDDAGKIAIPAALADLPEGSGADGVAAIAGLAASIEGSINELKHATATADEDTRRTLDALNATMELLVDRMTYLEGTADSAQAEYAAYQAEPAAPAENTDDGIADEDTTAYAAAAIPEVTIAAEEPAFEAPELAEHTAAEEPVSETVDEPAHYAAEESDDPAAAFGFEASQESVSDMEPEPDGASGPYVQSEADPGLEYALPEGENATAGHEPVAEDSQPEMGPESAHEFGHEFGHEIVPEMAPEAVGEPATDYLETQIAPTGDEPQDALPATPDEPVNLAADVLAGPAEEDPAAAASDDEGDGKSGVGAMLGRLTSSQILKRATGGRADSFTPAPDESATRDEDEPTMPDETGFAGPALHEPVEQMAEEDAPEAAEEMPRTRQGAGLGDLAAASGLGFDTQNEQEPESHFLSAARRAARAAVLEAASFESSGNAGNTEIRPPKRKLGLVLVLTIALLAAVGFAGYKYWRGELDFNQLGSLNFLSFNLDGFSFAGSETGVREEWQLASVPADAAASEVTGDVEPEIHLNTLITDVNDLEQVSPSAEITFGAPETSAATPLQIGETLKSVVNAVTERLSAQMPGPASEDSAPEMVDTVETTASVAGPAEHSADMPIPAGAAERVALVNPSPKGDRPVAPGAVMPAPLSTSDMLPASIGSVGLRQAALANIPEAQFEIASRFADGSGVESDLAAAAHWYEKAAAAGLAPAQYRLGSLYEKGRGVAADRAKAYALYTQAATAGNAKAMHNLAVLYAGGGDGEPDLVRAAEWFQRAADHGVRDSQFNMGILYSRGLGVAQDMAEAYKWFAIAADSGDEQAGERRDSIANSLGQDALAEAISAAGIFQPLPLKPDANLIIEPKGGWAAAALGSAPDGRELVSQVQALLSKQGFDPGPADGLIGRRTSGAIEAFQREAGMPITGKADLALLIVLQSAVN